MYIYERIIDDIKRQIISGEISVGDYVPSLRETADMYNVSLAPTLKAYKLLEQAAYINAIPGKGYVVAELAKGKMTADYRQKMANALSTAIDCAEKLGLSIRDIELTVRALAHEKAK